MNRILCLTLLALAGQQLFAQQPIAPRPLEVDSAIVAYNAKDFAKARQWALKATSLNEKAREAWEILGFAAQSLDDFPTMITAGTRMTELFPAERNGWFLLSLGHYRQGRLDLAVAPMRELCRIDPAMCASSSIDKILSQVSQDSLGALDSTFRSEEGAISVTLPKSWHTTSRSDGKTMNWFVTLEKIQSDSDAYSVGGTFRWIRNISSSFLIEEKNNNPAFLVDFWDQFVAAQMKGFTPHLRKIIDSTSISRDGWSGMIRTIDFQYKKEYPLQRRIEAILARKDEVFAYTLECDDQRWAVYEPRFKKAISSLVLPK